MTSTTPTPSTGKVRRDVLGGKRGAGHAYQDRGERVRRPDPTKVTTAGTTERLTSAAGLVAFGQFLRQQGIDRELHSSFDGLKTGHGVVYSMANQMRLMLDAHVAGESRVFGIEALASDPVFVRLAGGTVPCVDTLYRDLGRFDENAVRTLEAVMAHWGTDLDALRRLRRAHLDIDTSVLPVHGAHEGALPGYNPGSTDARATIPSSLAGRNSTPAWPPSCGPAIPPLAKPMRRRSGSSFGAAGPR
jgi:hypothetical protein